MNSCAQNERTIIEIEADLRKWEAAYADADVRVKDAQRERDEALDLISKHQVEFDNAVAKRRQEGTPGSPWCTSDQSADDGPTTEIGQSVQDSSARSLIAEAVEREFDRQLAAQPSAEKQPAQQLTPNEEPRRPIDFSRFVDLTSAFGPQTRTTF